MINNGCCYDYAVFVQQFLPGSRLIAIGQFFGKDYGANRYLYNVADSLAEYEFCSMFNHIAVIDTDGVCHDINGNFNVKNAVNMDDNTLEILSLDSWLPCYSVDEEVLEYFATERNHRLVDYLRDIVYDHHPDTKEYDDV
jgi:hypothetical protein